MQGMYFKHFKDFCLCNSLYGCLNPVSFTAENITETSALIKWSGGSGGNTFTLRYKEVNTDNFIVLNNLTTLDGIQGISIYELTENTIYTVEIIINCETNWKSLSFKTNTNEKSGDFDEDFDEDFD